jgi:predicted nucleic acid-binding protein
MIGRKVMHMTTAGKLTQRIVPAQVVKNFLAQLRRTDDCQVQSVGIVFENWAGKCRRCFEVVPTPASPHESARRRVPGRRSRSND